MTTQTTISLGVRDFALPVPRIGSIETHSGYGPLPTTGQEVHYQFQQERRRNSSGDYEAEYKLRHIFGRGVYHVHVSGRVDGFISGKPPIMEEIKTDFNIFLLRKRLEANPNHPYWLQVKLYAYIHYLQKNVIPNAQLALVSIRDGSSELLPVELNIPIFEDWLVKRLDEVIEEFKEQKRIVENRQELVDGLNFPFEVKREGQQELIAEVKACVDFGGSLMLQAPTGLGKTLGVMYPTFQSAFQRGAQVIYVTPKNSQHAVARDAIERIKAKGSKLKALVLTAKSKICMKEETFCNPEYCEYAKDYYEKMQRHDVVRKVTEADVLDKDRFVEFAEKYKVCPFELSLDSIKHVDTVVGDYNYVFSPFNIMGRFSNVYLPEQDKPDLIIDEAHNLPSRATGYYSSVLSVRKLKDLELRLDNLTTNKNNCKKAKSLLSDVIELIQSHRPDAPNAMAERHAQGGRIQADVKKFNRLLSRATQLANEHLRELEVPNQHDPIFELHRTLEEFVSAAGYESDRFVTLFEYADGGTIKIVCCDASDMLKDSYHTVRSVVSFSATLKPFEYYRDLMGLNAGDLTTREFVSPFPPENRKLLVVPQISTKYKDRERNYDKIAEAISKITAVKKGNYIVFFPSFDFLHRVAARVGLSGSNLLLQQREMPAVLIEEYLNTMKRSRSVILFAVQGGVFAEGVDYPGDMLIGSIIVGPALPTYDLERETLIKYFDERYGNGNAYACIYPAMSKVIQSAGRVIRSPEDRGLIVLLGRRFIEKDYMDSMPDDWFMNSANELVSTGILADLDEFWDDRPKQATLELFGSSSDPVSQHFSSPPALQRPGKESLDRVERSTKRLVESLQNNVMHG